MSHRRPSHTLDLETRKLSRDLDVQLAKGYQFNTLIKGNKVLDRVRLREMNLPFTEALSARYTEALRGVVNGGCNHKIVIDFSFGPCYDHDFEFTTPPLQRPLSTTW